jgi:hypothetical protein
MRGIADAHGATTNLSDGLSGRGLSLTARFPGVHAKSIAQSRHVVMTKKGPGMSGTSFEDLSLPARLGHGRSALAHKSAAFARDIVPCCAFFKSPSPNFALSVGAYIRIAVNLFMSI